MKQLLTKQRLLAALAAAALALGCGTSDTIPGSPTHDSAADLADLQEYVAIGNSLTAGYQSGAWGNPEHVAASYPNLIARQLGIAGFKQVSMAGTGLGFSGVTPVGNMVVNFDSTGTAALSYTTVDPANLAAMAAGAPVDFDFNAPRNLGIPGITLMHAMGAPLGVYAAGNPYAAFYTNASSSAKTQVQLAAEAGANFITCWLGNNDVLGYVTSGGTGAITPSATFQASLSGALGMLANTAAYLAVVNIPAVTAIPFVTYMNATIIAQLDALGLPHAVYAVVDGATTALPLGGGNYVLLSAATAMSADPTLGASPLNPLPDAYVLDSAETAAAQAAVEDFNARIAAGVTALNAGRDHDALLVDMNAFFNHVVAHGVTYGGETFTAQFVEGGIFSLDGVHPTSLGYAIVANEILETVNAGWGFDVELVDPAEFIGVTGGLGSVEIPAELPDFGSVVELFQH
jgi:lysophospholipase L1-like esterase